MPIQAPDPVGSYFAGRQARQQEDYGRTRNALAEMEAQQMPTDIANRNALAQRQQQQFSAEQAQQALTQGKAAAEHIAQHAQAKAFAESQFPEFVKMAEARTGKPWQALSDQEVQQFAGNVAQQAAAKLGMSPVQQVQTIGDVNNPSAGILQKDPTTGALKQVVAPQKPDHFNEAEKGRNDRAAASIAARPTNQPASADNVEVAAQAISNYQQAPLGAYAMRSPYGQAVMARVMELNPDYQANEFGARSKAYKDFASGKQGTQVASFNRSFAHLDTLGKLSEALGNNDIQGFNKLKNSFASQTGKAAPSNFDAAKKVVADEIVKAIVGAGGGVADREEAARTINSASSPAQLAGVVETYKELIGGQLSSLQQQYEQSTGRKDFNRFLSKPVIDYARDHPLSGEQVPGGQQGGDAVRVNTPQEAMALPPGTVFMTPDGRRKVR